MCTHTDTHQQSIAILFAITVTHIISHSTGTYYTAVLNSLIITFGHCWVSSFMSMFNFILFHIFTFVNNVCVFI